MAHWHRKRASKRDLQVALVREVERWSALSYQRLRSDVRETVVEEREVDGLAYTVEVDLLEDLPEYVHVAVAVDDGSLRWAVCPLSHSFLVYPDGRVDE